MQLIQPSLAGGELSPSLYARADIARYQSSVRQGKNFLVRPYGGMVNRPGTGLVARHKDDTQLTRLLPFQTSTELAFVIELRNEAMRFVTNGALVLEADALAITVIAGDELTIPGHTFAIDDWIQVGGILYNVTAVAGDDVTVENLDGSVAAPAGASAQRVMEIETPYTQAELWEVTYTQSADTMILAHPDHPPQQLQLVDGLFVLTEFETRDGPFDDPNTNEGLTIASDGVVGQVELIATQDLFLPEHEGSYLYLQEREQTSVKPWAQAEQGLAVGDQRRSDGKVYQAVTVPLGGGSAWTETGDRRPVHTDGRAWDGGGEEATDGSNVFTVGVEWEYLHSGFGIVQIVEVVDGVTANAQVIRRLPDSINGTSSMLNEWKTSDASLTPPPDGVTRTFNIAGATALSTKDYKVFVDASTLPPDPYHAPPIIRPPRDPGVQPD